MTLDVKDIEGNYHKEWAYFIVSFLVGLVGVSRNALVLLVIYRDRRSKKSQLHDAFVINQTYVDLVSSVFLSITSA